MLIKEQLLNMVEGTLNEKQNPPQLLPRVIPHRHYILALVNMK